MLPYKLDYTIEKITKNSSNREQKILKKLTGKSVSEKEAGKIWSGVQDHKWYVSERLGRDVGFRVAAVDFIENVYPAKASSKNASQPGFLLA
jgi:Domain of unknown function (DUF4032)